MSNLSEAIIEGSAYFKKTIIHCTETAESNEPLCIINGLCVPVNLKMAVHYFSVAVENALNCKNIRS